jgi:hypothetical protein
MKTILFLLALAVGAAGLVVASPSSVDAGNKKAPVKTVKKCDAQGKECKKGKNCKPENCKKAPKAPEPEDEDENEDDE